MKRMLINATQPEELRVAIVDGQKLFNLDIESPGREQKKANIYKGSITRVEPSLEAAFVDYGAERHGFLPLKEIARGYFSDEANKPGSKVNIKDALSEGREVIVQIDKEERGNKGAALTTFVSLAGRYLVLMPNNPRAGGVSRRIEGNDRSELRDAMSQLEIPENMGLIVRTAGVGKSVEELQWDLNYLTQLWTAIEQSATERKAPFLIYQESDVIIRSIRDHLRTDIGEIVVDDRKMYEKAEAFIRQVMPHNLRKLRLYDDEVPLFTRYQIESQIESAFQREVRLPSGGSIVIDHTEALTSIDINSARATKGADIEETALNTNLEAADEIARQLRLRDLGGLFVIDFIDMTPARNQREVENRLRDAMKQDRARVQLGRISRFGLMEMSRQRLRPSLGESSQLVCPRCKGQGTIRGVESLALSILRILEEEAMKENTERILAELPVDVATFLLNEKRNAILGIEQRQRVSVLLVPNPHLDTPDFRIERIRTQDTERLAVEQPSYQLVTRAEERPLDLARAAEPVRTEEPAIKQTAPREPAPPPRRPEPQPPAPSQPAQERQPESLLKRLWTTLFAPRHAEEPAPPAQPPQAEPARRSRPLRPAPEQRQAEPRPQEARSTATRPTGGEPREASRPGTGRQPSRREEPRREESPRRDEARREEARREEPRREEIRREEPRREESRREDARRPEGRRDTSRREDSGREPGRREDGRQEEPAREGGRREESRREEAGREGARREESRREETRREEPRRGEARRDEPRRDEPRREESQPPATARDETQEEPVWREEVPRADRGREEPRRGGDFGPRPLLSPPAPRSPASVTPSSETSPALAPPPSQPGAQDELSEGESPGDSRRSSRRGSRGRGRRDGEGHRPEAVTASPFIEDENLDFFDWDLIPAEAAPAAPGKSARPAPKYQDQAEPTPASREAGPSTTAPIAPARPETPAAITPLPQEERAAVPSETSPAPTGAAVAEATSPSPVAALDAMDLEILIAGGEAEQEPTGRPRSRRRRGGRGRRGRGGSAESQTREETEALPAEVDAVGSAVADRLVVLDQPEVPERPTASERQVPEDTPTLAGAPEGAKPVGRVTGQPRPLQTAEDQTAKASEQILDVPPTPDTVELTTKITATPRAGDLTSEAPVTPEERRLTPEIPPSPKGVELTPEAQATSKVRAVVHATPPMPLDDVGAQAAPLILETHAPMPPVPAPEVRPAMSSVQAPAESRETAPLALAIPEARESAPEMQATPKAKDRPALAQKSELTVAPAPQTTLAEPAPEPARAAPPTLPPTLAEQIPPSPETTPTPPARLLAETEGPKPVPPSGGQRRRRPVAEPSAPLPSPGTAEGDTQEATVARLPAAPGLTAPASGNLDVAAGVLYTDPEPPREAGAGKSSRPETHTAERRSSKTEAVTTTQRRSKALAEAEAEAEAEALAEVKAETQVEAEVNLATQQPPQASGEAQPETDRSAPVVDAPAPAKVKETRSRSDKSSGAGGPKGSGKDQPASQAEPETTPSLVKTKE